MNKKSRIGTYKTFKSGDESFQAHSPRPLPPQPPLDMNVLTGSLADAQHALGQLEGTTPMLPDLDLFLYVFIRKEAVLSSRIEGTQSSFSDLVLYEGEHEAPVPLDDIVQVSNYVNALHHGIDRLRDGMPLSNRLLREMHELLLHETRGSNQYDGSFRTSQNWIGGTRPGNAVYVPPPADEVQRLMGELEKFLHTPHQFMPTLLKAGLAHVQFESIHPFLDGNGRIGRLLITLLLVHDGLLSEPSLYLSLYLKDNRQEYYHLLQQVRLTGDWETWLLFFLNGVTHAARHATQLAKKIVKLFQRDRDSLVGLGRQNDSVHAVYRVLQRRPYTSIAKIASETGLTVPTATSALQTLCKREVVVEVTGRQRDKLFAYQDYLDLLNE
ncbi:MAG: Fic family protein [Candidatus Dependentiae bacterium]|jgi:Fic family protein